MFLIMKNSVVFLDRRSGQEPENQALFSTEPWHAIGSTMRGSGRVKAAIAF